MKRKATNRLFTIFVFSLFMSSCFNGVSSSDVDTPSTSSNNVSSSDVDTPSTSSNNVSSSDVGGSSFEIFEVADGWAIEKYDGQDARLTIPSIIQGHTIVEISDEAFLGNAKLLEVSLPNTIKRIGDRAFDECSRLYSINIPASCTSVGARCFAHTALTSITIPGNLVNFGRFFLAGCKLSKITFLNSLTENKFIGDYLNSAITSCVAYFNNGDNQVADHFKQTYEASDYVYMSVDGVMGNYVQQKEYYGWKLLDTNRFFNSSINVTSYVTGNTQKTNMKAFLNEPEENVTISTQKTYSSYNINAVKVSVTTETVNYIYGKFYLSLDCLEEIVVPATSTITDGTLLGKLENVKVTRK